MKILILLFTFFIQITISAQYVDGGIYGNVYQMFVTEGTGSSFTQDYKGEHFLITARHMFPKANSGDVVKFGLNIGKFRYDFELPVYFPSNKEADIAVIKQPQDFSKATIPFTDSCDGCIMGESLIFLGFPLGYSWKLQGEFTPIIKHAYFSGAWEIPGGGQAFLLDGHNNHGFSGGPACALNRDGRYHVFGVITAYIPDSQSIIVIDSIGKKIGKGQFDENSGIILAWPIKFAKEVMDSILAKDSMKKPKLFP